MLQVYIGGMLIVGLTKKNLEKLENHEPIHFDTRTQVKDVAIIYGDDKLDILAQLEKSGMVIPDWMRESVMKEPE